MRRIEWGMNEFVLGPRMVAGAEWCLFFGSLYKRISLQNQQKQRPKAYISTAHT